MINSVRGTKDAKMNTALISRCLQPVAGAHLQWCDWELAVVLKALYLSC